LSELGLVWTWVSLDSKYIEFHVVSIILCTRCITFYPLYSDKSILLSDL
jgi:hypothetical protein